MKRAVWGLVLALVTVSLLGLAPSVLRASDHADPLRLEDPESNITALAYQSRGFLLASAALDGKVILWQPTSRRGAQVGEFQFRGEASVLGWSPDDKNLAAGCDTGATPGSCTVPVKVCLSRADARLPKCTPSAIDSVQLVAPDPALGTSLLGAVGALGASTLVDDTVTFVPALPGPDVCTDTVAVVLPPGGKTKLKAKVAAAGGKPKDADVLRLSCTP